jgi:protein-L-isoaspartate(D-aspartate) O-methyltransferase
MHANACESLLDYLQPGAQVLDIGSGSGYLTVGIDHIQPLVDMANANMAKSEEGKKMLESGQVKFVTGDGRKGWTEDAPYDAIHVGAAAAEHHKELTEQLKAPGRLFVPVSDGWSQFIWVINKKEDGSVEQTYGVQYVPLTDAPK